jgi:hypothetical protein
MGLTKDDCDDCHWFHAETREEVILARYPYKAVLDYVYPLGLHTWVKDNLTVEFRSRASGSARMNEPEISEFYFLHRDHAIQFALVWRGRKDQAEELAD